MSTCSECKWWTENDADEPGYGECGLATNAWFLPPDTKVAVFPRSDDERIYQLLTARDFGCNQFEPSE